MGISAYALISAFVAANINVKLFYFVFIYAVSKLFFWRCLPFAGFGFAQPSSGMPAPFYEHILAQAQAPKPLTG